MAFTLLGSDPSQTLSVTSNKILLYPDQLLMSVIIRISELQAISPVKEVNLSIVGQGKYRLIIDMAPGKKGTWDFASVTPGTEAFTVTLTGSWLSEESAAASTIRIEVLKLQNVYDVTAFKWTAAVVAATLPAAPPPQSAPKKARRL